MHKFSIGTLLVVSLAYLVPASPLAAQTRYDSNVNERHVNDQTVQSERDEQEALFNYYFREQNLTYETRLDKLADSATVPQWRIPYSAGIHPETSGGLSDTRAGGGLAGRSSGRTRPNRGGIFGLGLLQPRTGADSPPNARATLLGGPMVATGNSPLSRYDQAFNGGQNLANDFEVRRIMTEQRGLIFRRTVSSSESWEGYCSGFTASTIRHPEPVRSVDAGDYGGTRGVVLSPSDIKALLTCIYNRTTDDSYLFLAPPSAKDGGPNMGTFHLALANYIGIGGTPMGIDRTKGPVVWNNPIYAYKVNSISDAGESNGVKFKELQTTITYSYYGHDGEMQTDRETGDRVGNRKQTMTIRYILALNEDGEIIGGRARSSAGHFLWIPLYAPQALPDLSVQGNPYVDVEKVIAIARAASLPEVQKKFDKAVIGPMIDPTIKERREAARRAADEADEETTSPEA